MTRDKAEKRKSQILTQIVRIYISTASPVSSKSVSRALGENVSSATIRNVMAELEEAGLIEQPHTSAGRCPTDMGYRHFVDLLMDTLQMQRVKREFLEKEYSRRIKSIKELIERTSRLINNELHYPGMIMFPGINDVYLKHIELLHLKAKTALAVLVTMNNAVRNYMINLDREIAKEGLKRMSNYLNEEYEGKRITSILDSLKKKTTTSDDRDISEMASVALTILEEMIDTDMQGDVFVDGMECFAEEPEFNDPSIFQKMLSMFSDKTIFADIMNNEMPSKAINIYIGKENKAEVLKGYSIVTSGYSFHGKTIGRLGVIGPRRMDYENVIRTMDRLSKIVSHKLEEL